VRNKATQTRSRLETGEAKLVESDGSEPDEGDLQRTAMKNRYANQRKGKQNELNGDSEHRRRTAGSVDRRETGHGRTTPCVAARPAR
jgi:hypothetical protein